MRWPTYIKKNDPSKRSKGIIVKQKVSGSNYYYSVMVHTLCYDNPEEFPPGSNGKFGAHFPDPLLTPTIVVTPWMGPTSRLLGQKRGEERRGEERKSLLPPVPLMHLALIEADETWTRLIAS